LRLDKFEVYFSHLQKISYKGLVYKRFFSSPILFACARRFGSRILEVGSGTGSGVLGRFPKLVRGLDINPMAVEYCGRTGLKVQLINDDSSFPIADDAFDVCILDNVLEHIVDPKKTLDECYRITGNRGGLVIAVPGIMGFNSDPDHKVFYDEVKLRRLDDRWTLSNLFSIPFFLSSKKLSISVRQYCLVTVYKKRHIPA
jgi:SAM-dependent methyltransferase